MGFNPKVQTVNTFNIYKAFQQAWECCALYCYFGAKMGEENKKKSRPVITAFEQAVLCWRQKFGTELDGN